MIDDTRERVIRLEEQVKFLRAEAVDTNLKVTAMHDLLTAAKGVRWAIIATASFAGFLSGAVVNVGKIIPWFGNMPK